MSPSVSVIIAVHNNRPYLADAVDSILNQSLHDIELIIINDGSTDGSTALLKSYADNDRRIKLIEQENKGLTKSLNRAVKLANAEFIARMDDDDISLPHRLQRQLTYMQEHPECVCCGCFAEYIDAKNRRLFCRTYPKRHEDIIQCQLSGWGGFILHPSAMFRKSAFEQVHGYDESLQYAQDMDLWFRLAMVGKLANLAEYLIRYRRHAKAISSQRIAAQNQFASQILNRELEARGLSTKTTCPEEYQIFPDDSNWLLQRAAQEGNVPLAFRKAARIVFQHIEGATEALLLLCKSAIRRNPFKT